MLIENSEALKSWLTANLRTICEADPDALAKYILALVKKDKPHGDLSQFCSDQLDVFLGGQTAPFVRNLFEALRSKSYLLGYAASNPVDEKSSKMETRPLHFMDRAGRNADCDNNSEISSPKDLLESASGFKSSKNRSREGDVRKRHMDDDKNQDGSRSKVRKYSQKSDDLKSYDKYDTEISKSPEPTRKNVMSKIQVHDPLLHDHCDKDYRLKDPNGAKPLAPDPFANKQRCLDYDEKGYCMKGELCSFDHGTNPILIEDVAAIKFSFPLPQSEQVQEAYNPEAPGMYSMKYWVPPPLHIPPPNLQSIPPPSIANRLCDVSEPPPYHKPLLRTRELIGVPIVENKELPPKEKKEIKFTPENSEKYLGSETVHSPTDMQVAKKKGFDFTRLGPRMLSKTLDFRTTSEVRNIPKLPTPAPVVSSSFSKVGNVVTFQDALSKKLELLKKKQDLLKSEFDHWKIILQKLNKSKNEKEKDFLKETLKTMDTRISSLQINVKKDSEDIKVILKTASVQMCVNKPQKTKSLSLVDSYSPQSQIGQFPRFVNPKKFDFKGGVVSHSGLSIDRRPRKVVVSGSADKDGLIKHFMQFGRIETIEECNSDFIFEFRTRVEAEAALSIGSKFRDALLSIAWYQVPQTPTDLSVESEAADSTTVNCEAIEEDDDEDDDNEGRSWRR